jgi:hypothetical protein
MDGTAPHHINVKRATYSVKNVKIADEIAA